MDWPNVVVAIVILCMAYAGGYVLLRKEDPSLYTWGYLPNRDLAVYTQITDDAVFSPVQINATWITDDMVIDKDKLVGAYLIEPVRARQPILRSQIVIPPSNDLTQRTRVVTIPVDGAAVRDGEMSPGEIVSIWIQPRSPGGDQRAVLILPKVLILNAQKGPSGQLSHSDKTFMAILVVPEDHLPEFLSLALFHSLRFVPVEPWSF